MIWKKKPGGIYLYYFFWQVVAASKAKNLHQKEKFHLVHHVTFTIFRQPSFMGAIGIPFILGPLGGGETAPRRLRKGYGIRGQVLDMLRDAANFGVNWDPFMQMTFQKATKIYAATPQTGDALPKNYAHKVSVHPSIAFDAVSIKPTPKRQRNNRFNILYAGSFLYWKGMHLGLQAFSLLAAENKNAWLTMVGDGPEKKNWQSLASQLGINHKIYWQDFLAEQQMLFQFFDKFDLFLFPSLHESGGTVVLESMAYGLPVICLDLGGPGMIVDDTCGVKIQAKNRSPYQVSYAMALAMRRLAENPCQLGQLRQGALKRAQNYTWEKQAKAIYSQPVPLGTKI